jgi:mutator protein MutT
MDSETKTIKVCAAVVRSGGKTLLCKRPEGSAHAGFWEFPGGKVDAGETERECLRREMLEELGCETLPLDVVFRIAHEYPGKRVSVAFYRTIPAPGAAPFAPKEGQELRWVDADEIRALPLLPADLPVAEFLLSRRSARNK